MNVYFKKIDQKNETKERSMGQIQEAQLLSAIQNLKQQLKEQEEEKEQENLIHIQDTQQIQDQLSSKTKENMDLKSQIHDCIMKIAEYQRISDENVSINRKLSEQIFEHERRYEEQILQIKSHESELKSLKEKLEFKTSELDKVNNDLNTLRQELFVKGSETDSNKQLVEQLQKRIEDLNKSNNDRELKLNDNIQQKYEVDQQLLQLHSNLNSYKSKYENNLKVVQELQNYFDIIKEQNTIQNKSFQNVKNRINIDIEHQKEEKKHTQILLKNIRMNSQKVEEQYQTLLKSNNISINA